MPAAAVAGAFAVLGGPAPVARGADGPAPGAPGQIANWTEGDKDGFGTATALASKVWFTLDDGELTEVHYPDLGTPSVRDLQFAVSDGRTFSEREREDALHEVRLVDRRSLTYRQVSTARSGRWRITKTYVTDPARAAVLVDVDFKSLTDRPYQLYALYDPALPNSGDDDRGERAGDALVAFDGRNASALMTAPAPRKLSSGYLGPATDGRTWPTTTAWTGATARRREPATSSRPPYCR